jgi:hypothetical protein
MAASLLRHLSAASVLAALAVLFASTLAMPATASAAPIRGCGDMPSALAFNITTRSVSCREARGVVRGWNNGPARHSGGNGPVRGLYCRYRSLGFEAADIRCTGSRGRVVHWQTGV